MRESFPLETRRALRSDGEMVPVVPRRVYTETGRISELIRVGGEESGFTSKNNLSPHICRGRKSSCLRRRENSDDEEHAKDEHEKDELLEEKVIIKTQAGRWAMLFYLSALAMLSDWICFCAAPIAKYVQEVLLLHDAHLVTCFLATNVISCLLEPAFVRRFGLRAAVVWGATVMALGCGFRSAAVKLALTERAWGFAFTDTRLPAIMTIVGTMLVAGAQPLFQCTPSLLAANWFGENETTLAVTVALNANQLGIAGAYAIGASLIHSENALLVYFRCLFFIALALAIGTRFHFRARPRHPPSYSAFESRRREAQQSLRRKAIDSFRRDSNSYGTSSPRKAITTKNDQIPRQVVRGHTRLRSGSWAQAQAAANELIDAGVLSPPTNISPPKQHKSSSEEKSEENNTHQEEEGESSLIHCSLVKPKIQPVKLVRRWLVITHKVGHGALDITQNLYTDIHYLCKLPGFSECLTAFVASIVTSNIFSTFLPHLIARAKLRTGERNATTNARIACLGALFQLMIMIGSLAFGAFVDYTKAYKFAMHTCFFGTLFTLILISDDHTIDHTLDIAVLLLGFFVGPMQPIAAELAVEQTYPKGDENAIVATQQTCGNFVSALAVPAFKIIFDLTRPYQILPIRFDYAFLALFIAVSATAFRYGPGYHAPLARVAANANGEDLASDEASEHLELRSSKYNSL